MLYIILILIIIIIHKKFKRVSIDDRYKIKINHYWVATDEDISNIRDVQEFLNNDLEDIKKRGYVNDVHYTWFEGGVIQIINYDERTEKKKWVLKRAEQKK